MSLRLKIVLALVVLSVATTGAIGLFALRSTAQGVRTEVDRSLSDTGDELVRRVAGPPDRDGERFRQPRPGLPGLFTRSLDDRTGEVLRVQYVGPAGRVLAATDRAPLPVAATDLTVAGAGAPGVRSFRDVTVDGVPHRLLTESVGRSAGAVQVARSLEEGARLLASLRNRVLLAVLAVVALAAGAGWFVAAGLTDRLRRLTGVAEEVAGTGRLDVEVPVGGADEAGRLGVALNEMLATLRRAEDDQQRLVQDAGHELKTPLTSLRANVAVLARHPDLGPEERERLVADLESETRELTHLVDEVVMLANGRRNDEGPVEVVLRDVVAPVVERARRRTGRDVHLDADDTVRTVEVAGIERAVSNLVDNAAKFDDTGGPIEVHVVAGRVEVLDRGPGIDPAEGDRLFDRFYRSEQARSRPGSGLGLAIVADVVRRHGGTVFARPRDGGGAVVGFDLPPARLSE